jgi:hypothetical protein
MRLAVVFLVLLGSAWIPEDTYAQFRVHKSETEVARMTPEQRVEEACQEYARHGLSDSDYEDLLEKYIGRDGLKAVPYLAKVIEAYDPTRPEGATKEKNARSDAAEGFLGYIDSNVVRMRTSEEGRTAIEAMRALLKRMRAAHFDTSERDDERNRYDLVVKSLKEIEGINACDEAIRNSLRLRHKISLSDQELLDLTNYVISQDPYYPTWSERGEYKDLNQHNEAGNPIWYVIMKEPERFYNAYLEYKAKSAR